MTHQNLCRQTAPTPALLNPRAKPETGIVHLGLGNFHRAHQAMYTAAALAVDGGPWGILGVANRSRAIVDAMKEQDLLYSIVKISPRGSKVTVPAAHSGVMVAQENPAGVVDALADPATRIVTITVTERGYTYSSENGALDVTSLLVRKDLSGLHTPTTTVGQIARALIRRARTHGSPVTVVSCDNLLGNGNRTAALVREFISHLLAGEADEILAWMDVAVRFPNSMVDRIVPASADEYNTAAARALGVTDRISVPAEPFSMWVMEDSFAAGRPAWEVGGAVFTEDVEPYELMKVRLLNGTHSLIAYLGALDGRATIPDSIAQQWIADSAREIMTQEYLPTVTVPASVDIDAYTAQLFDRWSNSALGHRTSQVGSDGSVKLAQRIPIPAQQHLDNGTVPHFLALTVAAYLCCMAPPHDFDPGHHARAMADNARPQLAGLARQAASTHDYVRTVFLGGDVFPSELAASDAFISRIATFVDIIIRHGPAAAVTEAFVGNSPSAQSDALTHEAAL
ncbi:mannitol dehydrogenase family protein [Rhodococcus erythropolis]|uniref:mannitol dehydrogenase family protein n=1 Tax=Rhodococcus erythropolis TaxID=1833 RepID=UPI00378AF9D7